MGGKNDGGGAAAVLIFIVFALIAGNSRSCSSGGGGGGGNSYYHGKSTGQLQSENTRLQEAQQQAAQRLQVERRRSAQLVDEIGTRRHVEALDGRCRRAERLCARDHDVRAGTTKEEEH